MVRKEIIDEDFCKDCPERFHYPNCDENYPYPYVDVEEIIDEEI